VIQAILSFDVDAETPMLVEGRRYADNAGVMSHQAYGPLVGVPRIIELLAEYSLPATFFIPGLTAERYPETVERTLEALVVRVRPRLRLSLMDADRPSVLETPGGDIVELPVHCSLDDWEQYAYLTRPSFRSSIESPQKVFDLWTSELDAMRRYGCLFVLTCHPFLSGRPHRVEVLRALIEHALSVGDVEFIEGREAARRARADDRLRRRRLEPVVVDEQIYPGY
jgi:peptidoglycan-N-acetylglucosamine deacetylase